MAQVYWITGLSGAGKTTIGKLFFAKLKDNNPATVFLDGDALRQVFGNDLGYSKSDRQKCAMRYSRLCKFLSEQGITVVICTISMFHSIQEWNKENIKEYKEIYVKVRKDVLIKRDQKGLYSRTSSEMDKTVSGFDFEFEEPLNPDYIVENNGDVKPEEQADLLYDVLFKYKVVL